MVNYLLDKEFLKKLFSEKYRETYARIIALNNEEKPLESLEGKITQGSVNIDGRSSLRRTCSLTFSTPDANINSYYWALTNKFKLEIGLKNNISDKYPEVVYFPFGVYIITSFSVNYGANSYSISIQGKDKMCLINGDVSGELFAQHDFGVEEYVDNTTTPPTYRIVDMEIEEILRELIHNYAHEPYQNIIIKDIPKYGMYILNFIGSMPKDDKNGKDSLYAFININSTYDVISQEAINNLVDYNEVSGVEYGEYNLDKTRNALIVTVAEDEYYDNENQLVKIQQQSIDINKEYPKIKAVVDNVALEIPFNFYSHEAPLDGKEEKRFTKVLYGEANTECVVCKIIKGQSAGYKITSLTYPRDPNKDDSGLAAGVGDNITTILDKIVSMLGDYEYFYNEYGQFVFQKRAIYADRNWKTNEFEVNSVTGAVDMNALPTTYWSYEDNELVTSYSNSPNIGNIKNDFTIWGEKPNGDYTLPIHMRYAIDTKPVRYTSIRVDQEEIDGWIKIHPEFKDMKPQSSITYISEDYNEIISESENIIRVDWRELIYQMSCDYLKYNHFDTFNNKIEEANSYYIDNKLINLYPGGKTGYEQYYIDINGFWRELYNPISNFDKLKDSEQNIISPTNPNNFILEPNPNNANWLNQEIFVQGEYLIANSIEGANACILKFNDEWCFVDCKNGFTAMKEYLNSKQPYLYNNMIAGYVYEKNGIEYIVNPIDLKLPANYIDFNHQEDNVIYHKTQYNNTSYLSKYNMLYTNSFKALMYFQPKFQAEIDIFNINAHEWTLQEFIEQKMSYLICVESIETKDKYLYRCDNDTNIMTLQKVILKNNNWVWEDNEEVVYRVGPFGIVTSIQLDCSNIEYPINYVNLNEPIKIDDYTTKIDFSPIASINNLLNNYFEEDYYYLKVNFAENKFTAISTMPSQIKNLFFKLNNKNMFDVNSYKTKLTTITRTNSGDFDNYIESDILYYQIPVDNKDSNYLITGWRKNSLNNPENLIFWFDFLDSPQSEIGKMSVKNIMDRSKSVNESEIKAIYYRENLNLFYLLNEEGIAYEEDGYEEQVDNFNVETANEKIDTNKKDMKTLEDEIIDINKDLEILKADYEGIIKLIKENTELTEEEKETACAAAKKEYEDTIAPFETEKKTKKEEYTDLDKQNKTLETKIKEYNEFPKKETKQTYIERKYKESLAEQKRLLPYIESTYSRYIYKDNKEANYFMTANVGKSCKEVLDQFLYNYTYATETINISSIPIYHLQPNDIVILNNKEAMLEGHYVINSLSIPLTYNGTMNINATKLVTNLY